MFPARKSIEELFRSGSESDARTFFEEWPIFLLRAFLDLTCDFIASEWVTNGSQRIDFVVVESISTIVKIKVVELESPTDKLFMNTSKSVEGKPSKVFRTMSPNLRVAVDQVAAYTDWIERNEWAFRDSLAERADKILPCKTSSSLTDRSVRIVTKGTVVIGNRSLEDSAGTRARTAHNANGPIQIAPYDRIIDIYDELSTNSSFYEDYNNRVKAFGFLRRP